MAKTRKTKDQSKIFMERSPQGQLEMLKMENSILKGAYFQLKKSRAALEESEKKYHTLVESANEIVFIAQDNRIKYANKRAFDVFGYTAKEIAKRTLADFIHPDDRAMVMGRYRNRLAGKTAPSNYEFRVVDKRKAIRWVLISPALIQWDGKPADLILMTDVSDLKKAEDEIKESEVKFRSVIEHITDVVFSADPSGKITFITPNISHFGYNVQDVIGCHFTDFIHPEDKKRIVDEFKTTVKGGPNYPTEFRMKRKDGSYVPVEESDDTILENGKPIRLVGTFRNISQRIKAEQEIKFKNLILSIQQEVSIDGILMVDENGKIISINQRFFEIWGIPKKLRGTKDDRIILKFVTAEMAKPKEFLDRVLYLYRHKQERSHEEIVLKDGRIIDRHSFPMYGTGKEYFGRVWYFRDITAQKKAEKLLQDSESQYRMLFSSMQSGFALHEIICDKKGTPIDYRFLEVNPAFEAIIGLKSSKLIGKTVLQILPGTEASWIETYGKVALTGKSTHFENYSSELKRYYEVLAYSPKVGTFATLVTDITERKKSEQKLRESEEKFRVLTESATDQIFMVDRHYNYLSVNKSLAADFKSTVDMMVGKPISSFFPKKTANRLIGNIDFVFKTSRPKTNFEEVIRVLDQTRTISISLHPIKDAKGQVIAVAGIARDVTETKKIQAALQESEIRNRTLVNSLPACIKLFDDKGKVISINAHGKEEHGLQKMSDEEIRKWDFFESVEKQDVEKVKKGLAEALKGKMSSFVIHHTHTHAQGGSCFSTLVPVRADGKVKFVLFTSLDVTEQQKMQSALQESEERYRDIVENSTEMIHSVDADNRILFVNTRECELLGYTHKELIGKSIDKIYSKDLLRQVEAGLEKLKKEGTLYIPHSKLVRKNGDLLDVEVHSIAIYGKDGKFIRTRSILIDITQRQRIEEELQKKVEQMEFMGRANLRRYKHMLEMEKEINELKGKLAEKP